MISPMRDVAHSADKPLSIALARTLGVMRSACEKDKLMSVWPSDVEAVEAALARVAELNAALSQEREECAWQPIETAPRDGTAIWLLLDDNPYLGYFDPFGIRSAGKWFAKASFTRRDAGGNGTDEIYCCNVPNVVPTHWMPLPSAAAIRSRPSDGGADE